WWAISTRESRWQACRFRCMFTTRYQTPAEHPSGRLIGAIMSPMKKHVALLRGINVGGHQRIAMADLRALLAGLGHTEVSTFLQSGNALFSSGRKDGDRLARDIEQAI